MPTGNQEGKKVVLDKDGLPHAGFLFKAFLPSDWGHSNPVSTWTLSLLDPEGEIKAKLSIVDLESFY